MAVYELINPSDPYTFEAPDLTTAGVAVALLSPNFGAKAIASDEQTPIIFGWSEWFEERGVDGDWVKRNMLALADVWDSFLIGGAAERRDVQEMLVMLPEEKREEWRAKRQDRHRTSLNRIGEAAYSRAKAYRLAAAKEEHV